MAHLQKSNHMALIEKLAYMQLEIIHMQQAAWFFF